jgi:hypothetical protein
MVSHILFVVDGTRGTGVAIERAPDRPMFVRPLGSWGGIANHYVAPYLASDPKNQFVRDHTSTLARQSRIDELLHDHDGQFDPNVMLSVLRDRNGPGDRAVPLGNRGTLDAWIATHSVIADATAHILWVSDGPHALGRYERFDLDQLLSDEYQPGSNVEPSVLPMDSAFESGLYAHWVEARALLANARDRLSHGNPSAALVLLRRAEQRIAPEHDMDELLARAQTLTALHRRDEAIAAWRAYLLAAPSSPSEVRDAREALRTMGVSQ